jgi:ribosome-binding factor A
MNHNPAVSSIKRAQKEAQILKEISKMLLDISLEAPSLQGLFINKVELSTDKSLCRIFFYAPEGEDFFKERLETLKLYKPSMRKGLSQVLSGRYTPDLKFIFDEKFEKHQRLEELLEKVSKDTKNHNSNND